MVTYFFFAIIGFFDKVLVPQNDQLPGSNIKNPVFVVASKIATIWSVKFVKLETQQETRRRDFRSISWKPKSLIP